MTLALLPDRSTVERPRASLTLALLPDHSTVERLALCFTRPGLKKSAHNSKSKNSGGLGQDMFNGTEWQLMYKSKSCLTAAFV